MNLFDQADDPNIGFGDLGRKLGEMWHALDENEKEDYRRRARWDQNILKGSEKGSEQNFVYQG